LARSSKTEHRLRQRARIVLLAAEGEATRSIARAVHCTIGTASKWRVRFADKRLAGLDETGDRGAEPKYTGETDRRILAVLDNSPPAGFARWTGPLIARALGDVDFQYVWRFLRAQKIDLSGRKSWCESDDPEFAAKAAEIVGLYLDPPANALVLAVDEKPHIQALERAQGYLKLRTAAPSRVSRMTTSATARAHCLLPSMWPMARSRSATTAAGAASSSSTS
jgi:transposase